MARKSAKKIACPVCGKLSRKGDMRRHNNKHLSFEERMKLMIHCPFEGCKRMGLQKSNMDTHILTHTQTKLRKCPELECLFESCHPSSLTKHRQKKHQHPTRSGEIVQKKSVSASPYTRSGSVCSDLSAHSSSSDLSQEYATPHMPSPAPTPSPSIDSPESSSLPPAPPSPLDLPHRTFPDCPDSEYSFGRDQFRTPADGGFPIFVASKPPNPQLPPSPILKHAIPGIGSTVLEEIAPVTYWPAAHEVTLRLEIPCSPPPAVELAFFNQTKANFAYQFTQSARTVPAANLAAASPSFEDYSQPEFNLELFEQQLQQLQQHHAQQYSPIPSPTAVPIALPSQSWSLDEYTNGAPTSEIPLTASWDQLYTPPAFSGYDPTYYTASPPSPGYSVSSDDYCAPPTPEEIQQFILSC